MAMLARPSLIASRRPYHCLIPECRRGVWVAYPATSADLREYFAGTAWTYMRQVPTTLGLGWGWVCDPARHGLEVETTDG